MAPLFRERYGEWAMYPGFAFDEGKMLVPVVVLGVKGTCIRVGTNVSFAFGQLPFRKSGNSRPLCSRGIISFLRVPEGVGS